MSYGEPPTELVIKSTILFVSIYLIPLSLYKFSKLKYAIKQKFYQALLFIILAFIALSLWVYSSIVGI